MKPDGTPDTAFHPNDEVTRAQFGTMLSRLLYGNDNNGRPGKRYEAHLKALKSAGIMTKISKPMMLELR
ncbi:MAG: S-layer homology domain-containing protein [bacterium]